jgi:hypothetical protein
MASLPPPAMIGIRHVPGSSKECYIRLASRRKRQAAVLLRCMSPDVAQMRSARCPLFGRYQRKSGRRGHRVFGDAEVTRGGPLLEVAWRAR